MSQEEVEALLVEMEPEIRAADRDMHEIGVLEQKGVTAAGKLTGKSWPRPPFCRELMSAAFRLRSTAASLGRASESASGGH